MPPERVDLEGNSSLRIYVENVPSILLTTAREKYPGATISEIVRRALAVVAGLDESLAIVPLGRREKVTQVPEKDKENG